MPKIEGVKTNMLSPLILVALFIAAVWTGTSVAVAQPAGEQRGYAAQRERLVTGLQLDVEQQKKLDAMTAAMLPRVLALQSLDKAQRGPARAQLTLEAQHTLNAMLTPDQRATYALMQAKKAAGDTVPVPAVAQ